MTTDLDKDVFTVCDASLVGDGDLLILGKIRIKLQ